MKNKNRQPVENKVDVAADNNNSQPKSTTLSSAEPANSAQPAGDNLPKKRNVKTEPEAGKSTLETLRDWVMIFLGIVLIIFAALNLFNTNPISLLKEMRVTPPVDQAGFAPIFIPREAASDIHPPEVSSPLYIPDRIVIDQIGLDAPVKIAQSINVSVDNQEVTQFLVPEESAAGWHEGSASLGVPGNTVISGHHNAFGEVFKDLVDLETGDRITLLSGAEEFSYFITNKMILSEKNEPLEIRIENGRWILPSEDERLTLVTCWPKNSNTHRLILVAIPAAGGARFSHIQPTPQPALSLIQSTPVLSNFFNSEFIPTTGNKLEDFSVLNPGRFSVNIRGLPDIQGEIIGSLKSGHSSTGLGRTALGDWILIKTEDTSGWVSAELVEVRVPVEQLPTISPIITAP